MVDLMYVLGKIYHISEPHISSICLVPVHLWTILNNSLNCRSAALVLKMGQCSNAYKRLIKKMSHAKCITEMQNYIVLNCLSHLNCLAVIPILYNVFIRCTYEDFEQCFLSETFVNILTPYAHYHVLLDGLLVHVKQHYTDNIHTLVKSNLSGE